MDKARDIMKKNPVVCYPETSIREVANLMIKYDCGEIPVIEPKSEVIEGVITDRDIVVRTIGDGLNPMELKTSEVMTVPAVTVKPDSSLQLCIHQMERNRIRRIPVVDDNDRICGIISLEDIAAKNETYAAEIMREISKTKSISLQ